MSDFSSSLPVRTEANGDVVNKIVDYTVNTQGLAVDSAGNAQTKSHGNDPASVARTLKLSERGYANGDGFYDATNNTVPANSGLIAHTRAATPAGSDQIQRVTAVTSSTIHALDIAIHDSSGAAISNSNPLIVALAGTGTTVQDYKDAAAVAAAASDNHDYTVTALKTLTFNGVESSASGKAKMVIQVETAVASGVFTTYAAYFNSTANPNMSYKPTNALSVAAGVRVRIIMTNKDVTAQDLYSTIIGSEV